MMTVKERKIQKIIRDKAKEGKTKVIKTRIGYQKLQFNNEMFIWDYNEHKLIHDKLKKKLIKNKHYGYTTTTKGKEKWNTQAKKEREGTWNVRTMLTCGKMEEIACEMKKYKNEILAIHEVIWKGERIIDKSGYAMMYAGENEQGKNGVGFMV